MQDKLKLDLKQAQFKVVLHQVYMYAEQVFEDVLAQTFSTFRRRLKPFVFQQTYPDTVI